MFERAIPSLRTQQATCPRVGALLSAPFVRRKCERHGRLMLRKTGRFSRARSRARVSLRLLRSFLGSVRNAIGAPHLLHYVAQLAKTRRRSPCKFGARLDVADSLYFTSRV